MELQTIVVGPFAVNCYLFWDEATLDGVIIDPGAEVFCLHTDTAITLPVSPM
jgi:hypothetical protein